MSWRKLVAAAGLLALVSADAMAACVGSDLVAEARAEGAPGIEQMLQRAAKKQNGQGRLWKVQRNGLPDSYLFGTFHAAEAIKITPPMVWNLLDNASSAVFEISPDESAAMDQRMATDQYFAFDPSAIPLRQILTDEQNEMLAELFQKRNLPVAMADQMRPWMLASLLGFPPCYFQAVGADGQVLDDALADRAAQNGIPISGLEKYEEALSSFGSVSRERLMAMTLTSKSLLDLEEDHFRTNFALYQSGNIAAIEEFAIWLMERHGESDARSQSEEFLEPILYQRNHRWMTPLVNLLADGGAFVAVGALHLPGQDGLVSLLQNAGFTVTRISLN